MKKKISVVIKRETLTVGSVHDRAVDEETAMDAKSDIPKRQTKMKSEPCVKEEVALDLTVDQLVKDVKNCRNQKPKQPKITSRPKRKKHVNENLESEDLVTEFKEENTKPKISLTDKNSLVDNQEFDFYCCLCNEEKKDYFSFMNHFRVDHHLDSRRTNIKHPYLKPDVDDPNFYCRSCENTYRNNTLYRIHLKSVHKMILVALSGPNKGKRRVKESVLPDPEDPNHYCRVCKKTFQALGKYRSHLRSFHRMLPAPMNVKFVDVAPDPDDPNFHCKACLKSYRNIKSFRAHIRAIHKMKLERLKFVKRAPTILPDWNDPDYYCRSCEITYNSVEEYHSHCTITHGMESSSEKLKERLPDPDDLDFYCRVCEMYEKDRPTFRYHCRHVHHMKLRRLYHGPKADPTILPDALDPNNHCRTCDSDFSSRSVYRVHLRSVHCMWDLPPLRTTLKNVLPDTNDPNFYCRSCDQTLSSRHSFSQHNLNVHFIQQPPTSQQNQDGILLPDVNDPNFFCRTCQRKYQDRSSYRNHLKGTHKMVLKSLLRKGGYDPNFSPDPYDPNFFCRVCKITKQSWKLYRTHCRQVHRMKLGPFRKPFVNPDAEIDLKNPDLYCAVCDTRLSTSHGWKRHLRRTHKLEI